MSTSGDRYHHGALAAALLEAADALLGESGAATLSLREVARRAGVSHNAPYHHFADRQALLKRLSERHMSALLDAQRAAASASPPGASRLRAMAVAYVDYAADHPQGFALVFDPEVCVPGAPSETMAPLIRANEELIADVVGEVDPRLDEPARAAAVAGVWGLAHGLANLVVAGHLPRDAAAPGVDALVALVRGD
ncbi:TetR/AcrR family transcriptional regulator [Microbacterium gilvum]|uniref:TetR/AcrR family transcriptional regulator n=1 Tax=Microbacterium gilvum TaxID=1336204 RepID=A0ABP9AEV5_9MICO